MGLYAGGLIIGRIFAAEFWGLIFGRAYLFIYLFFGRGGGVGLIQQEESRPDPLTTKATQLICLSEFYGIVS